MSIGSAAAGPFKFLRPRLRPQSTDITAAATWGVAAGTTGLWLVQPFDWIKNTFFKQPESQDGV